MDKIKLKWIRKLAKSKNFVLLTDDESVINVKNVDLHNFDDVQKIANQQAALEMFRSKLTKLIGDYEKAINKAVGFQDPKQKKKTGTKIPVTKL